MLEQFFDLSPGWALFILMQKLRDKMETELSKPCGLPSSWKLDTACFNCRNFLSRLNEQAAKPKKESKSHLTVKAEEIYRKNEK